MTFDRFAQHSARVVASAAFFAACVLLVVLWLPSILLLQDVDTWQLVINTITTVITFLLVALLQNTQHRFETRTDEREDLMGEAVAYLLEATLPGDAVAHEHAARLRAAVTP